MKYLTKDSLLKLDTALCLGYSFSMLFFPTILTSMYFSDVVNESTLHMCRNWGGTLLSVGLGLYASIGKSDEQQQFHFQSRSLMWLTSFLSILYHHNLYNSSMYLQGMLMCGGMALMTGYFGFWFEESALQKFRRKRRYRRKRKSSQKKRSRRKSL